MNARTFASGSFSRHAFVPLHRCQNRCRANARIEALLDLVAGRLPNARRAFDACNADALFLDESMFEMFAEEYREASEKATSNVVQP